MKSRPKPRNMKEIERLEEQKPHRKFSAKTCYCCGKSPLHKHDKYSAAKATCPKCSKQGNYATVCKCKVVHSVEEEIQGKTSDSDDCHFPEQISGNKSQTKWSVNSLLRQANVKFKIDTGANVTIIPESTYLQTGLGKLQKASQELSGPGHEKLSVRRIVEGNLTTANSKETKQEIYTVKNLKELFLGRAAIDALNLVEKVETIHSDDSERIKQAFKNKFPNLLKVLEN